MSTHTHTHTHTHTLRNKRLHTSNILCVDAEAKAHIAEASAAVTHRLTIVIVTQRGPNSVTGDNSSAV